MIVKTPISLYEFDLEKQYENIKVTKTDGKTFYIDFMAVEKIYEIVTYHNKIEQLKRELNKLSNEK